MAYYVWKIEHYKRVVTALTEESVNRYPDKIENGHLLPMRGNGYHLHHKKPVAECFYAGVDPWIAAGPSNLVMYTTVEKHGKIDYSGYQIEKDVLVESELKDIGVEKGFYSFERLRKKRKEI